MVWGIYFILVLGPLGFATPRLEASRRAALSGSYSTRIASFVGEIPARPTGTHRPIQAVTCYK